MSELILRHYGASLEHDSMSDSFEAILDEELVEIAGFVHVEVARVYLGQNVLDLVEFVLEGW